MFLSIDRDEVPKITPERLKELAAKYRRMTAVDILEKVGDPAPEQDAMLAKAEEYFRHFAWPEKRGRCINCDRQLSGQLFGGTFQWGLAHGEGRCGLCGYPARGHHYIDGVGNLTNFVLQYHPDYLAVARKEESDGNTQG